MWCRAEDYVWIILPGGVTRNIYKSDDGAWGCWVWGCFPALQCASICLSATQILIHQIEIQAANNLEYNVGWGPTKNILRTQ